MEGGQLKEGATIHLERRQIWRRGATIKRSASLDKVGRIFGGVPPYLEDSKLNVEGVPSWAHVFPQNSPQKEI